MSNEFHEPPTAQYSHWDQFFSQFSWSFLNFATEHHLRIDKYWNDFPSWRFSFKHPRGGVACIEVFREGEAQVCVFAYWWMDDYDLGTRSVRTYKTDVLNVESIEMPALLKETLTRVVSWPVNSWTDVTTGLDEPWKNCFTREPFQLHIDSYPNLKPYSVEGLG